MERLTPFGKYLLLDRINVGGMAEVFNAKTVGVEGFEKIVAIKRILPTIGGGRRVHQHVRRRGEDRRRSSRTRTSSRSSTSARSTTAYYIAMEYVAGQGPAGVQERMRRRGARVPLPVAGVHHRRACARASTTRTASATRWGVELNIVHRDVSPQNVIVSYEGEVKLIDFGIAKAANKITKTQAGILKGKFGYMSPEQVRGLPLDRRSDIFAAGVVLYELCTGERLFTGSSDFSVLEKVQQAKITAPSVALPDIPPRLERIILKALARETDDRYQHAAELAQDLTRFLLESNTRPVSRDDVARFMKQTFPDDNQREQEAQVEATRTRAPRPQAPPPEGPKTDPAPAPPKPVRREPRARASKASRPPPAPAKGSLFDGDEPSTTAPGRKSRPPSRLPKSLLDLGDLPPEPEPTAKGPPPGMEAVAKALGAPPPKLPPLSFDDPTVKDEGDSPSVQVARQDEEDAPTRPMSLDELLAAERAMLADKQRVPAPSLPVPDREPEAAHDDPTIPGVFVDPQAAVPDRTEPKAVRIALPGPEVKPARAAPPPPEPKPARAVPPPPEPRPARAVPPPPEPKPARAAPPPPEPRPAPPVEEERVVHPWTEKSEKPPERRPRAEAPRLAGPHRRPETPPLAPLRARPDEKLPAYRGRMQVSKPTLVGDDPLPPEEITSSTLTVRQRWIRGVQVALGVVALGVAAWAWLSVPHHKEDTQGPPAGSLTVTTEPNDALVLLDGALVKEALDKDYTEPKLSAGAEHVLTVRRDGFTERQVQVTLQKGEQRVLALALEPLPNQLTVRSSPSGAQVFVDGQKAGTTPAYVPSVDPDKPHAVVLEKKCFKPWQQGLPPNAGRREVMATLEPIPGACPGQRLEREEKPMPELPTDPAQMASIGFLSLGSRPSAQIYIDGVDIGRTTPIVQWPLKVGAHKIRLVVAGRKKELKLEILSGQTESQIVDLRKK